MHPPQASACLHGLLFDWPEWERFRPQRGEEGKKITSLNGIPGLIFHCDSVSVVESEVGRQMLLQASSLAKSEEKSSGLFYSGRVHPPAGSPGLGF